MKRRDLIRHLEAHGCVLLREGGAHSVYVNRLTSGRECGPGTMIFHPDPHYEDEFHTKTGGEILIVQYPGPTTAGRPIYEDRFNLQERRAVSAERIDR